MRRWRAPKGTAALLRERVSGCRRSPRPPAITIPRTRGMCANNGRLRPRVKAGVTMLKRSGRAAKRARAPRALGGYMRHSTRLAGCLLAVVLASPGLVGMGGFGGGREEGQPARDFSATFTDVDGTRMTVTRVTSGGDASLEGDLGRGRLRVPFDNIARVTFQPAENDHERVRAEVTLREGEPVALTVRSSTTFYGRTPAGAYQIRARDLKSVEFTH